MDINNLIQTGLIYALPVLFAITVHEAAHGYAARHLGDSTAWKMGRVTLNPAKHIDPLGTILMPLLLYFATSGAFLFGYAKPVPVRFGNLRNPKRDMVWVALAGPAANFIQAIVWALMFVVYTDFGVTEKFFLAMCKAGVLSNVVMFAFNLFPLPPLDGGRIVVGLLPLATSTATVDKAWNSTAGTTAAPDSAPAWLDAVWLAYADNVPLWGKTLSDAAQIESIRRGGYEVALDLVLKIMKATEADLGANAIDQAQKKFLVEMVESQAKGIVHNANSRKLVAPLALTVFIWIFLLDRKSVV